MQFICEPRHQNYKSSGRSIMFILAGHVDVIMVLLVFLVVTHACMGRVRRLVVVVFVVIVFFLFAMLFRLVVVV